MGRETLARGETEQALAHLVEELEREDYRNPTGFQVIHTGAFAQAKALVDLMNALDRKPWWRR